MPRIAVEHQLVIVHRVDIILPDALQHLSQQARVRHGRPAIGSETPGREEESSNCGARSASTRPASDRAMPISRPATRASVGRDLKDI